jgi:lambda family phage minor tail protein L
MPVPASIFHVGQQLEAGDIVTMFILDLSPLNVVTPPWYFSTEGPFTFQGVQFERVDLEYEGFEWNGQGAMPQPTIRITNVGKLLSGPLFEFEDLIGAKLIRLRTYRQFLDGGASADPTAHYDPDIYTVEQKTAHDKEHIEWKLAAAMDQDGRTLPGRTVYRDVCAWRYRIWDPSLGAFNYNNVTCPYTGGAMFDINGNPTGDPAQDRCSHRLTDGCRVRFGRYADSPIGAFPGVSRIRVAG